MVLPPALPLPPPFPQPPFGLFSQNEVKGDDYPLLNHFFFTLSEIITPVLLQIQVIAKKWCSLTNPAKIHVPPPYIFLLICHARSLYRHTYTLNLYVVLTEPFFFGTFFSCKIDDHISLYASGTWECAEKPFLV